MAGLVDLPCHRADHVFVERTALSRHTQQYGWANVADRAEQIHVVHIVEGYVFTPLVQKRIVHVAPAFLLIAQLLAGLFAGVLGIFVATPLAIALTIGVQKFYIEAFFGESPRILGDETAEGAR